MNSYEKSDGNNEMDCQSDTESYEYTRIRCRKGQALEISDAWGAVLSAICPLAKTFVPYSPV